jgi:hypothetical protein
LHEHVVHLLTDILSPLWLHQDYMDPNIPTKGFLTNVRYMFDLRDVVIDVQGAWEVGKEAWWTPQDQVYLDSVATLST